MRKKKSVLQGGKVVKRNLASPKMPYQLDNIPAFEGLCATKINAVAFSSNVFGKNKIIKPFIVLL